MARLNVSLKNEEFLGYCILLMFDNGGGEDSLRQIMETISQNRESTDQKSSDKIGEASLQA